MDRRWFLASVSLLAGGAGCLRRRTNLWNSTGQQSTTTPVCPPFETSGDRTICYRTHAGSSDEPVWLSVARPDWTVDASDTTIETNSFTLHNDSETNLRFTAGSWELHKQTDTGWTTVPQNGGTGVVTVESGETYRWSLSRNVRPSESVSPSPSSSDSPSSTSTERTEHVMADIDAGRYAFVVRVPSPHGDGSLDCLALFTLTLE